MGCITTTSFVVLINGSGSEFFISSQDLQQECPLSHYLFLLVAKGLSKVIHKAQRQRKEKDLTFGVFAKLTHLLSVDNALLFCLCFDLEAKNLEEILSLFCLATGVEVNVVKFTLCYPTKVEQH